MNKPVLKKKLLPNLIALALGGAMAPHLYAADPATADAQTSEAVPAGDSATATVEVRGIRERLKRNLAEKRDAGNVIDTVTAEEVGKFPDKNVADSLQRVPGISVDRTWGEGRDIFVRGTDKNLNLTQLNGQAVASGYWWKNDSQSRGFNYDILASELVGSIDVYKSPSADLDEGSIGGLVNVKTRKPFPTEVAGDPGLGGGDLQRTAEENRSAVLRPAELDQRPENLRRAARPQQAEAHDAPRRPGKLHRRGPSTTSSTRTAR